MANSAHRLLFSGLLSSFSVSANGRYIALAPRATTYSLDSAAHDSGIDIIDADANSVQHFPAATAIEQYWGTSAEQPLLDGSGKHLLFASRDAFAAFQNPSNEYVAERQSGSYASVFSEGDPGRLHSVLNAALSEDGHAMAFAGVNRKADAADGAFNGVYLADLQTGALRTVYQSAQINPADTAVFDSVSLSADGASVAFRSKAPGLPGQSLHQAYVENMATGAITLASSLTDGVTTFSDVASATLSANGRYLVFATVAASNAIYVKDLQTGGLRLVSSDASGVAGQGLHSSPSISDDGRYIAFVGTESFGSAAGSGAHHLFVKDMATGGIALVVDPANSGRDIGTATLSGDGQAIVYTSQGAASVDLLRASVPAISGLTQDDKLSGTDQADTLAGGLGNDSYSVNNSRDVVVEYPGQGQDTVHASISYTLPADVENLVLDGSARLDGSGNALDNTLTGNSAANVLDGGAGNDSMAGGAGDDTYVVDRPGDQVIELAGEGVDTVRSSVSYKLGANVEALVLTGTADTNGTGNAGENSPTGNPGANVLFGGAGNDRLDGGGGNDNLDGGAGTDTAVFHASLATLQITRTPFGDVSVTDASQHVVELVGIERLEAADAHVALDIYGNGGQAYRIYQAAFNRTPDQAGLGYWIHAMDGGMGLTDVAANFLASAEFKTMAGAAPSNAALVETFYLNVLHRAGEAAGISFWTDVLDKHSVSPAVVLASFSESPENQAALIGVIGNGFSYLPFG